MPFIRQISCCLILLMSSYQAQAEQRDLSFQHLQEKITLGYLYEAQSQLQVLETSASQDLYSMTAIKGLHGYLALQQYQYAPAETLLTDALAQAQKNAWFDLAAHFELYLGQLHEQQQQPTQAEQYFNSVVSQAAQLTDQSLIVSSLCNLAKLAMANQKFALAWQQLQQAKTVLNNLAINPLSSQLWLNIGYQTLQLAQQHPQQKQTMPAAFDSLQLALAQAKQFGILRTQAASLNHLATLYQQQQPHEAIKLLLAGINIAQKAQANDLLINMQWQLAEIYKTTQETTNAITSYRLALKQLEKMRLDIPVSYQKGQSSFKTTFAPLYLGLADLLLQQAPLAPPQQQQQALLHEAQDTIELMKKTELEDYFQSRCELAAETLDLKKIDPHAAAIYPIPLADRLEIIVVTADGLHQFTQAVTANQLLQQAKAFSTLLRNPLGDTQKSKSQAQILYQWLIQPIKPLLVSQKIETLIYIPDGALRLVPLAALYNGEKFLIEDYAVVTSVGMSLIETSTIVHENRDMLLVGMSEPGEVIADLPDAVLSNLITDLPLKRTDNRQLSRGLKLRSADAQPQTEISDEKMRALRELLKNKAVIEQLTEGLSLPGVKVEIEELAAQNAMPYFLNEEFSLAHFTELADSQPHKILHIASHGIFGSTAEESFIMTYDKILNMNKLEALLSSDYFKQHPIDLITLSACQTAEGDDRSPLGISGIAIKSKVHSALGSLWSVSDEATSQLMSTFYQALKIPGLSKAKALQQAEIHLLKQKEFNNPSFWSPFILVGDWL